jgi:hypothetical protein
MNKNTKKRVKFQSQNIKCSFTGHNLTKYSGLSPIMRFIKKHNIAKSLDEIFPTIQHNATKFSNVQIFLSIILASLSGVNRMVRIAHFTRDSLVLALLKLKSHLNKDVIGTRFKELGQRGALCLQEYLLGFNKRFLKTTRLTQIVIDTDSTVNTVYGHQDGAAKGFNSSKKGAVSYHNLLCFVSNTKLLLNSWFRTGSAYTSNGIVEFLKQTKAFLPESITHVFFRADSGFFSGALFDLLEGFGWRYLVKVKLRNLKQLLSQQKWLPVEGKKDIWICEFDYEGSGWKKKRKLKAIRTIKKWIETEYFGKIVLVPEYQYACYCSNVEGDAFELHELYKQRSTSETWIEQIKSQLLAGKTLTSDFHANDILWQLNVFAYNLSIIMRYKYKRKRIWREEHETFREWFINLPAKVVSGGHQIELKLYSHYFYKKKWLEFDMAL